MAKTIKYILFTLIFLLFNNQALRADEIENVKQFVVELSEKFENVIKIESETLKKEKSFEIADNYLDTKWMGNFILGKHRRTLNEKQIDEFVTLFSKFLINNYLETLAYFSKKNLTIKEVRNIKENNYLVKLIVVVEKNKLAIDLKIVKNLKLNKYKIIDIIPENVSFLVAQRAEIDSIITAKGFNEVIKSLKIN